MFPLPPRDGNRRQDPTIRGVSRRIAGVAPSDDLRVTGGGREVGVTSQRVAKLRLDQRRTKIENCDSAVGRRWTSDVGLSRTPLLGDVIIRTPLADENCTDAAGKTMTTMPATAEKKRDFSS